MSIAIIIPARYESSRFPGKPLALISGIPMILRVWDKCSRVTNVNNENIFVATDNKKIKNLCNKNGINVIMTSNNCLTGTDRVAEAGKKIEADVIVNVQGDEPLINPNDIDYVIQNFRNSKVQILNTYSKIQNDEDFFNKAIPKVVFDNRQMLMYISRSGIPSSKKGRIPKNSYKQVCIYAYSKKKLMEFYNYGLQNNKSYIEDLEDIEIIRFLEMGEKIRMLEIKNETIAVDFPEDIVKVENFLNGNT